jgi:hypothetical protein
MADVINLFNRKKEKEENKVEETPKEEVKTSFDEIAKRNEENRKRIQSERAKANQKVLRTYNIK